MKFTGRVIGKDMIPIHTKALSRLRYTIITYIYLFLCTYTLLAVSNIVRVSDFEFHPYRLYMSLG